MSKRRVLFLCTHNSARSQMAEGFLRARADHRFEVASAGTEATRVHPLAIRVMQEIGVDLGGHASKNRLHWSFDDPSRATGSDDERLAVFRPVRDEIRSRLDAWLAGS